MKGLRKKLQHRPRQHTLVDVALLTRLHGCFNHDTQKDAAVWAALLFCFFTFFRRSNVVLDSKTSFDPKRHLQRKDVLTSPSGLLVYTKWSKTLQHRERVLQIPLVPIPDSVLCPVSAYQHMCTLIPASPDSPAFVLPSSTNTARPLTTSILEKALAKAIKALALPKGAVTLHDLRRGGYTLAFQAGVPRELRQLHGDWKSDADHLYLTANIRDRLKLPSALRDYILRHTST
ncbi:PREDICTED: uncharacterized protein LOC109482402 isoform X3 [Branchiostoma belcheri]|uniref:Uncharacterized protein LOC109482402 isoform X1 n=1 Tax=Branchiostoma belcheri TaxID=7741 RepID=A0A6P5A2U1_BRABE|nr:PREDICTED: uncharacterized protein LOC109482402 isoform X1 [Branchiostoma belcheri]XP_019640670.1 PREDICTED: uncharacterized protein LOC109482402 isoform X2 [Branchiostoma belcheri]XP_019640671.1 PREDICTED: uncharacterized protein LOC109482402 isoform X3 [Branchiostoma belcheri]